MQNLENLYVFEFFITQKLKDPFVRSALKCFQRGKSIVIKVSEYDQEMPQSHAEGQSKLSKGRDSTLIAICHQEDN